METEKKYGSLCFAVAFNILGNSEDAEECVNDTYFCVWSKVPPIRPNNFMAYICKITRNLSLKKQDYNKATKRNPDTVVSLSELDDVLPSNSIISDWESEKIGELISIFLRQEKPDARAVFIRRYWFLDSINDIKARYSFSESNIKNMLYHFRKKLKLFLKKEGIEV